MNEKMTEEELEQARKVADALNEEKASTVHRLLAHIATLTSDLAESRTSSDDYRHGCEELTRDRDTLRERVQALEHDAKGYGELMLLLGDALGMASVTGVALVERVRRVVAERAAMDRERNNAALRMEAAESSLSAIRQRAGDVSGFFRASGGVGAPGWLERGLGFVLGDDARPSAPPEAFTHEKGLDAGVFDWAPEETKAVRLMREEREAAAKMARRAAEPTAAEAFATARRFLDQKADDDHSGPYVSLAETCGALSLLERRWGALWRTFTEEMAHWPTCPSGSDFSEAGWARCDCHMEQVRTFLTDAPPVFTLEEVRSSALEYFGRSDRDRIAVDALLEQLAALRRTS
jgi:hypothetical protein